jgi:hypothetical protein
MARIVLTLIVGREHRVSDVEVAETPVKGENCHPAGPPAKAQVSAGSVRESPSPDIITPRNRGIMLRWLEGQLPQDIALQLGVERKTVDKVLRLRAVKQEIMRLTQLTAEEYIKDRVARMAEEALDTLRDTMRGHNGSELRFKAAKELLDKVPALRTPIGGLGHDIGQGLGEAIINRLAQLESEAKRPAIDVTETKDGDD